MSNIMIIIFCVTLYWNTTTWWRTGETGTTSVFWPRILIFGIFVFNLVDLFIKSRIIEKNKENLLYKKQLYLIIMLISIYIFGLSYVGFLLATLFFQWTFLWILEYRKKLKLIFVPIVVTFLIYIIFIKIIYVPLPRGIGIFREISSFFY
ncbi:hypothetical protein ES705_16366 [subsurface metagenome]